MSRITRRLGPLAPPIYLGALTVAEGVTTYGPPLVGMGLHIALLVALLIHGGLSPDPARRALFLSLTLAPLIRILSLSLPLQSLPPLSWYIFTAVPLFAAVIALAHTLGYDRRAIGLRVGSPGLQLAIALSGLALGVVEYAILRPEPLVAALTWQQLVLPALVLLIYTGFSEELVFRGVMQRASYGPLGRWAIAYVAAVFAVLHLGYRSPLDVLFVFGVGLLFGWLVARTGSLLGVSIAHGLTNIGLLLVLPHLGLPGLPAWPPSAAALVWLIIAAGLSLGTASWALGAWRRRTRRAAEARAVQVWAAEVGRLATGAGEPALTATARALWLRLGPDYVLLLELEAARAVVVVRVAIGASGRRLVGLQGLEVPWSAFAEMVNPEAEGPQLIERHPFSRHEGDYLVVPLGTPGRWVLVRARAERQQENRRSLAALAHAAA